MKYFEKISKLNVKDSDTLELELELQNPIDSSNIEEIKKELKLRYSVMNYYKNKFPNLDISFDWKNVTS